MRRSTTILALVPLALLAAGCAGTLWPPALAVGNSGVCLEDYDWTPLRLPTPQEARALGLAGETPTAEEPLSPGEHCAGPYVWGGEVSQQAAGGVGSIAEVALPPLLTGAGAR